jgi:DNA polymerase-3 subunit epsilon
MKIIKPIIFFDLETTGLEISSARIVQIACIKINLDGSKEEKNILIKPLIPIPIEASNVHGITDEKVENAPYFSQIAKSLAEYFYGCDVAGYNSDRYDFPLLIEEFQRCNIEFPTWELNLVDVLKYERLLNPNTLSVVYEKYTGKKLEGSHDALNDVRATLEVLLHQLELNQEVSTPEEIDLLCQSDKKRFDFSNKTYLNNDGIVCWSFGKNINNPVVEDMGYLQWVLKNDFPNELKTKIKNLIK